MKKKKWLYVVGAAAVVLLLAALLSNPETAGRLPMMLLSVAVGVVLMLAVVLAAFYFVNRNKRREEAFRDAAVAVTGRVIKIERLPIKQREQIYGTGEPLFLLRAQYDYEGKRYKSAKRSYFGKPNYEIGDPITVYVDPKEPTRSKILPEKEA